MTFYEMALDSDQIGGHFEDIDMPRLIDHQTKFVSSLVGGPASFSDDRIEAVHRHLNISHADFDEMADLFAEDGEVVGYMGGPQQFVPRKDFNVTIQLSLDAPGSFRLSFTATDDLWK